MFQCIPVRACPGRQVLAEWVLFFFSFSECMYFVVFDVDKNSFFEFVVDVVEGVDDIVIDDGKFF